MNTDPSQSAIVILSCSLNPTSKSHKLALAAQACLRDRKVPVELVDLTEYDARQHTRILRGLRKPATSLGLELVEASTGSVV